MSYETSASSSSRSISHPALPPSLHLINSQENTTSSNPAGGSKLIIKSLKRAFHHIVFPSRFGTVNRLEEVAEATVEDENAVCNSKPSNRLKRRTPGHLAFRPSTTSAVSRLTASHVSTPQHSPITFITSFPSLNASDISISSRSPTNTSPLSAVLSSGEDEECEDDPAVTLWHTERLHRARLAKLRRHLGEEIPVEIVQSPTFLSRGVSPSSFHPRRGGHHHKRTSLDPSAFIQEPSVTGSAEEGLRRSKSLKGQGYIHPTLPVTGTAPKTPSIEYTVSGVRSPKTTKNLAPIPNSVSLLNTTSEIHSIPPANNSNGNVPHKRVSMDTYSDGFLSRSSHPSVVEASSETPPFSHRAFRVPPPKSRKLPRRPATADASRRVETSTSILGTDHDDISVVTQARVSAQKLQFSPPSAAGDLAIGIHAPDSQPDVEVKVSKPTRFWNGRATTQSVRPDDVLNKLRMMRAS